MYNWEKVTLEEIRQGGKILGAKTCVFYLLKMFAGKSEDALAYPSQSTLSDISGLSPSSIQKALKQLKEAGWIKFEGYTKEVKRTAIYRICGPVSEVQSDPVPRKILRGGSVRSYEGGQYNFTNKKEKQNKKNINNKEGPKSRGRLLE